jgi:hypothetical protein
MERSNNTEAMAYLFLLNDNNSTMNIIIRNRTITKKKIDVSNLPKVKLHIVDAQDVSRPSIPYTMNITPAIPLLPKRTKAAPIATIRMYSIMVPYSLISSVSIGPELTNGQ